jgi:hypothetical protein
MLTIDELVCDLCGNKVINDFDIYDIARLYPNFCNILCIEYVRDNGWKSKRSTKSKHD